jgi:ribA/ribD-fused uncharacterized protein
METETEIYFYGHTSGKYACLSNFYPTIFKENGITYNCSEQYFMLQKCILFDPENKELMHQIITATNPSQIKHYGRCVNNFSEHVWIEHREKAMMDALMLKFTQNPDLQEILLGTGKKTLYEASKNDKIWGIGFYANDALQNKKKFGKNLLGKCLMEVRKRIGGK